MKTNTLPLIFLVDDDDMYRNLVKSHLKQNHFTNVRAFESGEECIKHLHQGPKIILLDCEMTGMNGVNTLKKINEHDPSIHVVLLSGQDKLEVAANALRYGAYDYVVKNEAAFKRVHQMIIRIIKMDNTMIENKFFRKKKNLLSGVLSVVALFTLYLTVEHYELVYGR